MTHLDSHKLDLNDAKLAKAKLDEQKVPTTTKSIRLKCLDCCCGAYAEVKLCQVFDCPLWQCRLGKRPATARRRTPQLLDPVFVAMAGHKQGLRECGCTEWIHPMTGKQETLSEAFNGAYTCEDRPSDVPDDCEVE